MARYKRPAMVIFSLERTLFGEIRPDVRAGVLAVSDALAQEGVRCDTGRICDEFVRSWEALSFSGRVSTEMIWKYLVALFELQTRRTPAMLDRIFCGAACRTEPVEGAADILELMANRLVRTSVSADVLYSAAWVEDSIDRSFPNHMAEFTVCSSEFVFGRGDRKYFEIFQQKAKIAASDIWYIGGDAERDVEAADAAGMTAFWFRGDLPESGIRPPRCDYIALDDWRELASIISELIPF